MFLIVRLAIGTTVFIVLPSDLTIDMTYCTENIVFVVLVIVAIAEEFPALVTQMNRHHYSNIFISDFSVEMLESF